MATWQFVADMASASPTVNLDLNNGSPFWIGDGYDVSPPGYDKSRTGGALRHGQTVTRSIANNRTLTLPLRVVASSVAAAITSVQDLGNQLRVDNILKVQFGATPVFFRTFADPEYALEVTKTLIQYSKITLTIEAEPFAYSPRVEVTGSPFTVSNDPAAGTNPCRFDITGVLGDVPSPLLLVSTSTGNSGTPSGLVNKWPHISTRRRGTPGNYSNVVQGEAMTNGTDTSTVADATMSGGSKARISFATNATLTPLRLSDTFPANGVSVVDARGEYRVYARCSQTNAVDTITLRLGYGTSSGSAILNDAVTVPAVTSPCYVDLGLVPVPAWSDPVNHGYSGVPLKTQLGFVGLYASRASGTASLDIDYLYFMPADDRTLIAKFPSTDTTYAIDGTTDAGGSVYAVTTALDEVLTTSTAPQIVGGGGFPEVIPGQTNRIHFLRNVEPTGVTDALSNTTTIRAYYWPRWLEPFRP